MSMLDLLKGLIQIQSTPDERWVAQFIQGYIESLHLSNLKLEKQFIWDGKRYNLIVKNTDNPQIILAGHMDTVPIGSEKQLKPQEIDWKLYGRWAVDMKWGLAIMLDLLPELVSNDVKFWMLFYADEEYYFKGMLAFVEYLKQTDISLQLVLIPEPTDNKLVFNFKWITEFELGVRWISAHSARKSLGKNPLEWIFEFIGDLEDFFNQASGVFNSTVNLAGIKWGLWSEGKIIWKGNQVPDWAEAMIEVRIWSDVSEVQFKEFVQNWFESRWYGLEKFKVNFYLKGLLQPELEGKYSDWQIDDGETFGYSDVAMIKEVLPQSDCLLLGPWPKNKAHQDDEYVQIESLKEAREKIKKLVMG